MGSGEKKVVAVLAVILLALLGVYFGMPAKTGAGAAPQMMMQGGPPGGMPQGAGPGGPAGMPAGAGPAGRRGMQQAEAGGGAGGAACAPGGGGGGGGAGVPTEEFGKKGAKVDIMANLPITHHCHDNTEAELKKIQKAHPNDVHLVVVDLFGKEGATYAKKYSLPQWPAIVFNGQTNFKVAGRDVTTLKQENQTYTVADLAPIVDQLLKGSKS